jgi:hypothetical protein
VGDKIEMRKNIEMSENMASVYFLRNYYMEVLEKQGMTIEVYVGELSYIIGRSLP